MDEVEIIDEVTCWETFMHFMCLPWKVVFQIIPQAKTCSGWPTFIISYLVTIGLCFLISETATAVGCLFDMCAGVQALTIIAIGLCLPDFYASQLAAESKFHNKAEAALGYLLATNAVKIFVGLGLPWTIKGLSTSGAANSLGQGIGLYLGGDQTADISLAVVMLAIISVLVIGTL